MNSRTAWVDYAKAIGIVLVVFGHVVKGLQGSGIAPLTGLLADLVTMVYTFHMPLFFFLSGLFFSSSIKRHGSIGFMFGKLDSIVYPYLIWSLVQGGMAVLGAKYANGPFTWAVVIQSLWRPGAQFWFLYALFEFFSIAVLLRLVGFRNLPWIACAISAGAYVWNPPFADSVIPLRFFVQDGVFFALGVLCTERIPVDRISRLGIVLTLALGFVIGQIGYLYSTVASWAHSGAALLLAVISIALVVAISNILSRTPNRFFQLLGSSSMVIYLLHLLLGSGARVVLKLLGQHNLMLHLVVGCLAGLLGPLAVNFALGRWGKYLSTAPLSRPLRFLRRNAESSLQRPK